MLTVDPRWSSIPPDDASARFGRDKQACDPCGETTPRGHGIELRSSRETGWCGDASDAALRRCMSLAITNCAGRPEADFRIFAGHRGLNQGHVLAEASHGNGPGFTLVFKTFVPPTRTVRLRHGVAPCRERSIRHRQGRAQGSSDDVTVLCVQYSFKRAFTLLHDRADRQARKIGDRARSVRQSQDLISNEPQPAE